MLPFVPRKVAKALSSRGHEASTSTPATSTSSSTQPSVKHAPINTAKQPETSSVEAKKAGKTTQDVSSSSLAEEDFVSLLWLALSPHAVWSDPDLRREIEQADEGCEWQLLESACKLVR